MVNEVYFVSHKNLMGLSIKQTQVEENIGEFSHSNNTIVLKIPSCVSSILRVSLILIIVLLFEKNQDIMCLKIEVYCGKSIELPTFVVVKFMQHLCTCYNYLIENIQIFKSSKRILA